MHLSLDRLIDWMNVLSMIFGVCGYCGINTYFFHALYYQVSADDRRLVARASALFCAKDSRPFSIIEREGFRSLSRELLQIAQHTRRRLALEDLLPGAQNVSNHVKLEADSLRREHGHSLTPNIAEFGGSATLDFWKEELKKIDYLSFTYHFADADRKFPKRLLYCAEYDSTVQKTAKLIRNIMFQRLDASGLSENSCKHLHFVTDAGKTLVNAFEKVRTIFIPLIDWLIDWSID